MKIRNWFNHDPFSGPKAVEKSWGVSMTIPDQALPLRTIIDRFVRGVEVYTKEPVYLGEDDVFAGVERMSVLERQDLLMQVNASVAAQRNALISKVEAREEAKRKSDIVEDQIMTSGKETPSANKKTTGKGGDNKTDS